MNLEYFFAALAAMQSCIAGHIMEQKTPHKSISPEMQDTTAKAGAKLTDCINDQGMKLGDYVVKTDGDYSFEGVIVSVVNKLSGEIRYVVEDDRGTLHVYHARQLKSSVPKRKHSQFDKDVQKFNVMYKLPVRTVPELPTIKRLNNFRDILSEEFTELDDVIHRVRCAAGTNSVHVLSELADFLGDVMIYCATFMIECGIPIDETLAVIMESNFSKLGPNGEPIYDERGKVMKGPNYWKPEEKLRQMLEEIRQ